MTYENNDRAIFSTKTDAFIWGALVGICLLGIAAIIGRVAWQVLT